MKNKELQASLIKSGIILVLCIFFIYAFAVDDSGGITGTISSIFSAAVFIVGLIIALAVSVIAIFAIYFGILAMYGENTCQTTYNELKDKLRDSSSSLPKSLGSSCCSSKEETPSLCDEDIAPLRDDQAALKSEIAAVANSVETLEKSVLALSSSVSNATEEISTLAAAGEATKETLETLATTASVEESVKKVSTEINSLQSSLSPVADKLAALEESIASLSSDDDSDAPDVQQVVDDAVKALKDEINTIKASVDALSAVDSKEDKAETSDSEEHRILSYFTKKADKNKFIKLVNDAIAKEMTYAQIGEYLNDSLSASANEITADHPSLTKDYIKTCRNK